MVQVLPKADAAKLEAHVFKVYDANNDGIIDFKEFLVKSISLSIYLLLFYKNVQIILYMAQESTVPEEILTRLFTVFDENG